MDDMNKIIIKADKMFATFTARLVAYAQSGAADLELVQLSFKLTRLNKMERVFFMVYILDYWYAYATSIINGTYKHVNLTMLVYNSWLEYMMK